MSANAVLALQDALAASFWFKRDLEAFCRSAVNNEPVLVGGLDWSMPTKREIVVLFVRRLVDWQDEHADLFSALILDVAGQQDFPGLVNHEDADAMIVRARSAVERLRQYTRPFEEQLRARAEIQARSEAARREKQSQLDREARLGACKQRFLDLHAGHAVTPQARGIEFEGVLNELFTIFGLRPRKAFALVGEQIDGAFELGAEHFILEAKWVQTPVARDELDTFVAKVMRRAENTLGLFVSVSGFHTSAIELLSKRRSPLLLMDGADLFAVLDSRIPLDALLQRKRRHAAQTGEIWLSASSAL